MLLGVGWLLCCHTTLHLKTPLPGEHRVATSKQRERDIRRALEEWAEKGTPFEDLSQKHDIQEQRNAGPSHLEEEVDTRRVVSALL